MDRNTSPHYSDPTAPIQKTLALIRPEAMCHCEAIVKRILNAGFKIIADTTVKLTPEQATELYADQEAEPHFPLKVLSLCTQPVRALCLAKPEAIAELRALLGEETGAESRRRWPGSLRAFFARQCVCNGLLCSRDLTHARTEIRFFFPNVLVDPPLRDRADQWRYLNTLVYPTLMEGVYEIAKMVAVDPVVDLAKWLWRHNPNKPLVCDMERWNMERQIDEMKAFVAENAGRSFERELLGDDYGEEEEEGNMVAEVGMEANVNGLPVIVEDFVNVERCPV